MLYGHPTRSAHRAAPVSLAVPVWQTVTSTTGQHRQPITRAQRRAPREPQRAMQRLTTGLGALIVLSILGLVGFFIMADERRGHAAPAGAPSSSTLWAISSRAVDPEPLSLAEVFPGPEITLHSGSQPYRVTMTHIDTDCDIATTGALGGILAAQDCSQVVRAAITAPYGGYQVTAGIFNLADEVGTAQVDRELRQVVETGGGNFAAMAVGGTAPGTDPQAAPSSQVGWHDRGHYLLFCVIERPDGLAISVDDPYAGRITVDLLESYLSDEMLGARTLDP
jgi:hypothetical protein